MALCPPLLCVYLCLQIFEVPCFVDRDYTVETRSPSILFEQILLFQVRLHGFRKLHAKSRFKNLSFLLKKANTTT